MAKCRIGEKKLRKCRAVTGANYTAGFVRGGWAHFWVECHRPSIGDYANWDFVNWKTGEWFALFRNGKATLDKSCRPTSQLDGKQGRR